MERRRYVEGGVGLTTIGGFVAGLPSFVSIPGPVVTAAVLTGGGVLLGAVGITIALLPFIPKWEEDDPTVRRVTRNDLKQAYAFCNGVFGENFSSFNSFKRWFSHNQKMFWVVEKTKHRGPARYQVITGFFSVLPLTKDGLDMLISSQLDTRAFSLSHIAQDFTSPAAYYIGAIASKGGKSKGVALGALIERTAQFVEAFPARIYTRPTTKDGLRSACHQGFEAIDGSGAGDLHKVYFRDP